MANFKLDFLLTQPDKSWHETYFRSASDIGSAAAIPLTVMNALCAIRHPLTVYRKLTVTDTLANRVSVIKPLNRPGTRIVTDGTPDVTNTAARVKLSSSAIGSSRSLWLRGLLDDDVKRNPISGVDEPSGFLITGIGNIISRLASNQFVNRGFIPSSTTGYGYMTIKNIKKVVDGQVDIYPVGSVLVVENDFVTLSQLDPKEWPAADGRYQVITSQPDFFTVKYNTHNVPGTYGVKKGRARRTEYRYGFINSVLSGFTKFTSRKTGGSPLGGRGRRSTLVRRSA